MSCEGSVASVHRPAAKFCGRSKLHPKQIKSTECGVVGNEQVVFVSSRQSKCNKALRFLMG